MTTSTVQYMQPRKVVYSNRIRKLKKLKTNSINLHNRTLEKLLKWHIKHVAVEHKSLSTRLAAEFAAGKQKYVSSLLMQRQQSKNVHS